MGLMICGKCQSESTYYEGAGLACMKCGNRSPSRWGFHRKGEETKAPEPIEEPLELEDEETEEEEIDDMGKKRTPEQRERIAAGIRAAMARKKAAAGGGQSKVEKKPKAPKPAREKTREDVALAPEKVEEIKARIRSVAKIRNVPKISEKNMEFVDRVELPDLRMSLTPEDPRTPILDFTLEENKHLYEPWTAYCRRFRRGPGDHAMQLIEETLKAANVL